MIVEKYVANPAANAFSFETVTLPRNMRAKYVFVIANQGAANASNVMYIYRGTISAYADEDNQYLIYAHKFTFSTTVGYGVMNIAENIDIELPAGTYTFACLAITDVANLKWAFHLV